MASRAAVSDLSVAQWLTLGQRSDRQTLARAASAAVARSTTISGSCRRDPWHVSVLPNIFWSHTGKNKYLTLRHGRSALKSRVFTTRPLLMWEYVLHADEDGAVLMFYTAFIFILIYKYNVIGSIKTSLFPCVFTVWKRLVRWSASNETQSAGVARQPTSHLLALVVKTPSCSNIPIKIKCVIETGKNDVGSLSVVLFYWRLLLGIFFLLLWCQNRLAAC